MKTTRSAHIDDEDLFSKLPDTLLLLIVSLLPAADAIRTRVLSKSWKNIWALLPDLHFVMPKPWSTVELNSFHHFVDQTLVIRGGTPIQRLLFDSYHDFNSDPTDDCVRKVLQFKFQEVELRSLNKFPRVEFSLDLLKTCSSLVSLTLRVITVLDIPDMELFFPCLKIMVLEAVTYSDLKWFANLISGCPVLEELVFEGQHHICDVTDDDTAIVSSSSLKRLSFEWFTFWSTSKVVIDAPKMEYLNIQDFLITEYYFMTKPLSVTEAHIKIHRNPISVAEFVTSISCVKTLTLAASTILALGNVDGLNLPVFPNLVKFVVGIDIDGSWIILPSLLNNMPNLEHITFADGLIPYMHMKKHFIMRWHPREEVPACLLYKMKEVIIKNRETMTPQEFDLIRYLLKHARKLETLTMNAHEIDEGRREQVLNFHRGSKSCRVDFI